jgi:NAD(P)-dependent dehydrogenase (short-subunit alcohol dehydrogenase family)
MSIVDDRANLAGKTAVLIGGGTNIGAACTLALAEAGVDIAFCDIREDGVEETIEAVKRLGRRVIGRVTDAFDPEQLTEFYASLDRDFGTIDILLNLPGYPRVRDFAATGPDDWKLDIHNNFTWVVQSTNLAIRRIRAGGRGGSIINFTTIEAYRGAATFAVYAGAKAGLANFSRALAVELAPEKIRVNVIAPDTTPSETSLSSAPPEVRAEFGAVSFEAMQRSFAIYIPSGTAPTAKDISDAALFLASDLSSTITGNTLHVDNGTFASSGFLHWPSKLRWSPAPPPNIIRDDATFD